MKPHRTNAFTLIESISVIVVLGVIGSLVATLVGTYGKTYADSVVASRLHVEASTALDRIVREIRSIPVDADAGQVAADIRSASATEIQFGELSHIQLNGTDVQISADLTNYDTLLTDVSAFVLQFYDEDDSALLSGPGDTLDEGAADTISARRVSISITVTRNGESETVESKVFMRATMTGTS
ncbi:MAG: hypothetical protein KAS72_01530 [Phycisphaerales bacterium]|nr:hypothetical protein [Phycisphaerales bacterium]